MWQFSAIGTQWSIETPNELTDGIKSAVSEIIESFDKTYSRFRDDSWVTQVAAQAGEYTLPQNSAPLIEIYKKLYKVTDGSVTPLVGDTLAGMGYDKDYSLKQRSTVTVPILDDVLTLTDSKLITRQPVTLDFGAAGKGYLVDLVGDFLELEGIDEYTIDASGDIRHRGEKAQIIGLENPHDIATVIGTMTVQNASLCASATNRRRWGDGVHHVIDGRTSLPTNEVIATWVSASSTVVADGLATALFFVGPDDLDAWNFQFVRLYANGKIERSENFVGELFI